MSHINLDDQEIAQRGKEIYEKQIRAEVEIQENIGKMITLPDFGDDSEARSRRARPRRENS